MYACPKFISPNAPPYQDSELLSQYVAEPPVEPAQRHCALFLTDVRTMTPVPTLRSFLKLYKSLDTKRLAGLVTSGEKAGEDGEKTEEEAEEELVEQMMVLKLASRSLSRPDAAASSSGAAARIPGGHLGGTVVGTSDLDFVIDEVRKLQPD